MEDTGEEALRKLSARDIDAVRFWEGKGRSLLAARDRCCRRERAACQDIRSRSLAWKARSRQLPSGPHYTSLGPPKLNCVNWAVSPSTYIPRHGEIMYQPFVGCV